MLLLAAGAASAQPEEERSRTAQTETPVSYVPKIDGAIKAKMEIDLNRGEYRFNVRNSRFGVRGNVSRNMSYRLQVDFSNEGKVSILDSYVAYKTHGFEAIIGQQQYHFRRRSISSGRSGPAIWARCSLTRSGRAFR